jgi:Terminase RNaseH-like domain
LIEEERSRLPERVFLQEYGAQFIEGSGAVFRNVRDVARGDWQDPQPYQTYHGGLDLAKVEDFSVLAVLNTDRQVMFVDRFHRVDWSVQVNRVLGTTQRFNRCPVLVDSTGAGEPIYESLKKAGIWADAYPFTQKSKAALVDNLSLCFEQRLITLPKPELWPEGIEELEAFEYSVTDSGNVKTSAPHGMHDDCVIALALAAWPLRPSKPKHVLIRGELY